MDELNNIFYGNDFLNKSLNRLINEVKKKKLKLSKEQIEDYYNNQEIVQIFKPVPKPYTHKILVYKPFDRVYCDTMFITSAKITLFNIVDYFTKYAMIFVFKKESITAKDALECFKKFNDFVESKGFMINKVYSDNGSEMKGVFDKYLNDEFIKHIFTDPNDKRQVSPIESFNRTVRLSFEKYIAVHGLEITKIKSIIKKVNDSYNNNVHSRTGFTPNEIIDDTKKQEEFKEVNIKDSSKPKYITNIEIGSMVRLPRKKGVFDKLKPSWSKKLYKVVGFDKTTQRYTIDGLKEPYPQWMLQVVDTDKLQVYKPPKQGKSKEEVEAIRKKERRLKRAEKELGDYTKAGEYYKEKKTLRSSKVKNT